MKKRVTALLVSLLLALLFVTSAYADTYSACGMVIRPPQKMSLYSKSSKSITYARTTGKVIDVLNYSVYPYEESFDVKVQSVSRGVRGAGFSNVSSAKVINFNDGRRAVYSTGYRKAREGHQYAISLYVQLGRKAILLTDMRTFHKKRSNPFTYKCVLKLANTIRTN